MGYGLSRRRAMAGFAVAAAAALGLTGCVGGAAAPSGGAGTTTLHLVGFAVPAEANKAIQAKWAETEDGRGVVWEQSYGDSGDQSRAVANGLNADYVNFSLEGDVNRLVDAGLVRSSQPRMFFGFPSGTTSTTTESETMPLVGPDFQSWATNPASTSRLTSPSKEKLT